MLNAVRPLQELKNVKEHKEVKQMAYVVEKKTGMIFDQCDAWDLLEVDNMVAEAKANGYENVAFEITPSGNMIIWAD